MVQPSVSEEKLVQPSVREGKLVQPSVSEGKLSISRISGLPSSIMEVGTVSYLCVHVCTVFNPDLQVSMFYLYSP